MYSLPLHKYLSDTLGENLDIVQATEIWFLNKKKNMNIYSAGDTVYYILLYIIINKTYTDKQKTHIPVTHS